MRCKLCTLGRKQIVFGVGNPNADLMFVGEAPGRDEDIQGIPFVGRAGQKLTQIIEAIGLKREDVYIANVIKCRPPENRNPEPDEVEQCEPFLFRQVDTIKPKVIVALGTFAAKSLLKTTDSISRLRGRVYDYRGAKLVPTFHPAFLLRNPSCRREVWEDMKKVRALLSDRTKTWLDPVRLVSVAVPVPFLDVLTYQVPDGVPLLRAARAWSCRSASESSPASSSIQRQAWMPARHRQTKSRTFSKCWTTRRSCRGRWSISRCGCRSTTRAAQAMLSPRPFHRRRPTRRFASRR